MSWLILSRRISITEVPEKNIPAITIVGESDRSGDTNFGESS
jgi:hypothetical protein